ncbi:sulfotransferase [Rhodoferax sp. GW822-FHT02A01]|uniref:sulfotransferase family protein n=1 Tax=Rhodoferax sp. GW822-FHT02A01 TaxID=3141537 RepID=UPI00315C8B63
MSTSPLNTARPRPLLMIPLRRCGSHALRLRLNFNPDFYSPYPLHIVDFIPILPLYGDLADDRNYFNLVIDVVGLQAASMVKWAGVELTPEDIFESIRNQPRSVHRIVWEMLLRAGEQRGARIVMDKSLDSVHFAHELMDLFPDFLFLNVVRDPRAQVASMNRAIIHDFDSTLNAMAWVRAHRVGQTLAKEHPERVLTIRYEDFLTDQEQILRKICQFIGMDFLPQMLDVAGSAEAQQLSRMSDLWASNCFAPIPANKDKFKTQLSMREIEVIETLTLPYMQQYGYERMTDTSAEILDSADMVDCVQRSEQNRTKAWQQLAQSNPNDYAARRVRADYLERVRSSRETTALLLQTNN